MIQARQITWTSKEIQIAGGEIPSQNSIQVAEFRTQGDEGDRLEQVISFIHLL